MRGGRLGEPLIGVVTGAVAAVVAACALAGATGWPWGGVLAAGVGVGAVFWALGWAISQGGSAGRVAGGLAGRVAVGVAAGVVLGELAAMVVFGGQIDDELAVAPGLDQGAPGRGIQVNDHAGALGIPAEAQSQDIAIGTESQATCRCQQQGAKHEKGQGGHGPLPCPPAGQVKFQCRAHSVVTTVNHRTDSR